MSVIMKAIAALVPKTKLMGRTENLVLPTQWVWDLTSISCLGGWEMQPRSKRVNAIWGKL